LIRKKHEERTGERWFRKRLRVEGEREARKIPAEQGS